MANVLTFGERLAPARRRVFEGLLRWMPAVALGAVCAYALVMIFTRVFFTSVMYDDGYYADISRNLAEGRGYITNYGEMSRTFNPEVSLGPTIILPSAFLQVVLGSHYWVANLIVPLMVLPMATAIGWMLNRRFGVSPIGLSVLALATIAFTHEREEQGEVIRFLTLWTHQMGDLPAVAFALLAALLVAMGDRRKRVHFAAGALLALGLYTRLSVGLALPGFAVFYAWAFWQERDVRQILAFAAGVIAIALPMELFRLLELGSVGSYVDNTRDVINFYRTWDFTGRDHDVDALLTQMGLAAGIFAIIAWAGLLGFDWARRRRMTSKETRVLRLAVLLLTAGAVHLFWWIVINDAGWYRHAMPGVMYIAVALTVLASHVRLRAMPFATAVLVAALLVTQGSSVTSGKLLTSQEPRLDALLATSDALHREAAPNVSFWGCGWWGNRDLAYVGDFHFYDCLDSASVWKHLDSGEQLILVRSEFWNWEANPVLTSLERDCDTRIIFQRSTFFVCDATPWLRANTTRP